MAVFAIIVVESFILFIVTAYLVKSFQSPYGKWDVTTATYISWVLGFAGTLLLPYDISIALVNHESSVTLTAIWDVIYWSTFFLAWVSLGIQASYHMSGEFSFCGKLYEAFKINFIYGVVGLVCLISFVIYIAATKGGTQESIVGFLMAMGNTYGVILIILLLGYGLVAVPRKIWHMGNPEGELTRLYMMAPTVESSFHDARFELEDCENEAKRVVAFINASSNPDIRSLKPFSTALIDRVESFVFAMRSSTSKYSAPKNEKALKEEDITKSYLALLHGRVIAAQLKASASERRWKHLVYHAKFTIDLINGSVPIEMSSWCEMPTEIDMENGGQKRHGLLKPFYRLHDTVRYYWRTKCYHIFCKIVAVICGAASILILWSEVAMSTNKVSPVGSIIVGFSDAGAGIFVVQVVSFLNLFYISLCTFFALFKVNLGWAYTLQGDKQSSDSALLYVSAYVSRLQFSLGYNFLLFLNVPKLDNTSFQYLMSNMEIVPLFGSDFSTYAPIITFIMSMLTLFNIYARILKFLGIEHEDSVTSHDCFHRHSEKDVELRDEGQKLVASQLRQLSAQILANNTKWNEKDNISLLASNSPLADNGDDNSILSSSVSNKSIYDDVESVPPISTLNKSRSKYDDVEMVTPVSSSRSKNGMTSYSKTPVMDTEYKQSSNYASSSRSTGSGYTNVSVSSGAWGGDDNDRWGSSSSSNKTNNPAKKDKNEARGGTSKSSDPWGQESDGWNIPSTSNTSNSRYGGRYG